MKCISKSLLSASNPCWVIWVDNEHSGRHRVFFRLTLWQQVLLSRQSSLGQSSECRVYIPSITNEHTLGQSGLGGNEGLTIMWLLLIEFEIAHLLPELSIFMDDIFKKEHFERESRLGRHKNVPLESQDSIRCCATQSDVSCEPKNHQKSRICVDKWMFSVHYRSSGDVWTRKGNKPSSQMSFFFSISLCLCANCFFPTHPVPHQFKYKHRILAWKILFPAANDVPLPPIAHNCPSFLTPRLEPLIKEKESVAQSAFPASWN